jgi:RHS repeat-associated protein
MTDRSGSNAWTYDANDQLTSESRTQNGQTKTASYAYFPNGYMKTLTTFGGQTVSLGYDALGRLVSQTDPNDGGRAITFAYDALSRPTSATFPSGVSQRLSYGPDDNLSQALLQRADGTALQRFDYLYGTDGTTGAPDADYWNGFVRSVTELDGSKVSYGYDDLGRLTSAVRTGTDPYDQGYTYDPNDNRTSVSEGGNVTTATYDAADQLTKQGTSTYTYDRNGNLLSDGAASYSYDASDKMTGGTTADGRTLAFGYDGEGRRVYRTVGTARTNYWYDATGMSLETGATNATYLRHPGGTLLSRYTTDVHNYMLDRLGHVTALTDRSGALAASYSYDPYGREIANTNASLYNPYRYGGAYQDADTGLSQMGARYYDASTGRFTQQDPLPESMVEAQRYGYTPGNPVNFIDPSGLRYNNGTPYPRYYGGGSSGGGLSSRRTCNSFAADTEVATDDGPVEISEIEAGDEVLAYDERTGEVGSYEVAGTITGRDAEVAYLTVGGERLVTTLGHPFYTEDRGWVEAGDLEVGDRVRQRDGGYGAVESLRVVREPQRMYNLSVAGAHTFFVGDGQWLVHNCGLASNLGGMSGRNFHNFLRGLQGSAARAGHATSSVSDTRIILNEARSRGYRLVRPGERDWVGGRHGHLISPSGQNLHFPLPEGF